MATGSGQGEALTIGDLAVPEAVARRAESFVGRRTTLDAIAAWLDEPLGSRPWFLVTGGPGSGKSALLAWLAGAGPTPSDESATLARRRIREPLRAVHFCDADAGRAAPSLDPLQLANGMARQLSRRRPDYFNELARQARLSLNITMNAGHVDRMIGPSFGDINVQSAASLFHVVLEALESTAAGPHLIAVDALDEAELWRGGVRIAELLRGIAPHLLENGIRILMTSRPVQSIIDAFPGDARWDLDDAGDADVAAYVRARLAGLGSIAESLTADVTAASGGNFLVAGLLTDFAEAHPSEVEALTSELEAASNQARVWAGLDRIYGQFLRREFGTAGESDEWTKAARPVLGTIAVAREKLASEKLQWLLEPDPDPLQPGLVERALPRCLQYLDGDPPSGPFGLYHFSFREFLFNPERGGSFSTPEWFWHRLIAQRFHSAVEAGPFNDQYGLRHLLGHLADAVRLAPPEQRPALARRLVALTLSDDFHRQHDVHVDDPVALLADFDRAMDAVSLTTGPDTPVLLIACALDLGKRRRQLVRPDRVFDLAGEGRLDRAERRLDLFAVDDHLRQAALLMCAWLASTVAPEAATELCNRVAGQLRVSPLPALLERVRADLERRPPAIEGVLHEPPPGVPEYIVATLEGVDPQLDPSMLEFVDVFGLGKGEHVDAEQLLVDVEGLEVDGGGARLRAAREAPFLVAHARSHPEPGDALLATYIALHAANSYVLYRNRSLWAILESVVLHPRQEWVRERTRDILQGALAGAAPDFVEGLSLTLLALQAGAGDPAADARWRALIDQTVEQASAIGWGRGSDGWAHLKRRVCVLAEIEHALGHGGAARDLAQLAVAVKGGFSGFQAPASMTMAETLLVTGAPWPQIVAELQEALATAHNVQDPVYCARTTSRVNAMIRWWAAPGDLAGNPDPRKEAQEIAAGADRPRYGAVHLVGEGYLRRAPGESMIELPGYFRGADTIVALAEVVYQRPVPEFARLNGGVDMVSGLGAGTSVVVPDAEFPALIAARVAAELMARDDLGALERRHALQRLVPVASRHPTALDTVLSRLLLVDTAASVEWVGDLTRYVDAPRTKPGATIDPLRFGPA